MEARPWPQLWQVLRVASREGHHIGSGGSPGHGALLPLAFLPQKLQVSPQLRNPLCPGSSEWQLFTLPEQRARRVGGHFSPCHSSWTQPRFSLSLVCVRRRPGGKQFWFLNR